jgi:hypothetical protein
MFSLESTGDGLRLAWDGQLVLQYNFSKGGHRPFVHPLRLPDSPDLTTDRATVVPVDHLHHQGLWVGWKKVNGVNFWEQPQEGADPAGYGRILHQKVVSQDAGDDQARFTTLNSWTDWNDVQHLTETRETTVRAPRDGVMVVDLRTELAPHERDVTLDLLRGEPGGGGLFYSGVAIRYNDAMSPGEFLDADGRSDVDEIFGSTSRWCGCSGRHSEDGQVYGITVIDHPQNPRHPTTWWLRNRKDFCLVQPSPSYHEPFELSSGEPLTLQYRIVVHRGPVSPDVIEEAAW